MHGLRKKIWISGGGGAGIVAQLGDHITREHGLDPSRLISTSSIFSFPSFLHIKS